MARRKTRARRKADAIDERLSASGAKTAADFEALSALSISTAKMNARLANIAMAPAPRPCSQTASRWCWTSHATATVASTRRLFASISAASRLR